ncbi:IST1-like protein [Tanacetum coccineum]
MAVSSSLRPLKPKCTIESRAKRLSINLVRTLFQYTCLSHTVKTRIILRVLCIILVTFPEHPSDTKDYIKMEMQKPLSSKVKFIATCSYSRLNDFITSRKNDLKLLQTLISTSSSSARKGGELTNDRMIIISGALDLTKTVLGDMNIHGVVGYGPTNQHKARAYFFPHCVEKILSFGAMNGEGKVVSVTGTSGFIASWLIKLLLTRGYTAHATVRSLEWLWFRWNAWCLLRLEYRHAVSLEICQRTKVASIHYRGSCKAVKLKDRSVLEACQCTLTVEANSKMSKRSREYIKEKDGKHVSTILGGLVCLHSVVRPETDTISSLCSAAPRCTDLPELYQVQMDFARKYGKEFVATATELMPEHGVSRQTDLGAGLTGCLLGIDNLIGD